MSQLETNISTLEGQLKDAEERVQLLTDHSSFEFTKLKLNGQNVSDVEVARDMEKKVMANNIRIKTLEQQNEMLRKSIALLSEAQSNPTRKGVGGSHPVACFSKNKELFHLLYARILLMFLRYV